VLQSVLCSSLEPAEWRGQVKEKGERMEKKKGEKNKKQLTNGP
jgi:hypothetical protein